MPYTTSGALDSHSPSTVGLTRLSTRMSFPPGGEVLYRSIMDLVELTPESEFLLVPCGRGRGALFVAEHSGASGAGADPDPTMAAVAAERAKAAGLSARLHFEHAPMEELPYQDEVFDLVLAEIELAGAEDPAAAVRELTRVTRTGGTVALVQLVWLRALDEAREAELVERLGVRPLMLMQWKQMLRDAGVEDLEVQDWSDPQHASGQPSVLGGLSVLFTLRGKLRLLPRAWERWGWRGVRAVLSRERELRHLLEEERVLGVSLIMGRCAPPVEETADGEEAGREEHHG